MTTIEHTDLSSAVHLRRELLARGLTDRDLRSSVRHGVLHRVRRGAYVDAELWGRLDAVGRHRLLARAVLKAGHPSMALTHVSAAIEHGAHVWGIPLDEVHTTRTDGRGGRREAGVVHHVGRASEEDVAIVAGARVVNAARCAAEVTTQCGVEPALVTVNSLLHQRACTMDEFQSAVDDLKHWPSSLPANIVRRLADSRLESVAESRVFHLCWAEHLPIPTPQLSIRDERGREIARVDLAWPGAGVFLEFDGRLKYDKYRREGESLADYLMREKRREEEICQRTGWVCIRLMWEDLARPEATAARIRRLIDSRGRPDCA